MIESLALTSYKLIDQHRASGRNRWQNMNESYLFATNNKVARAHPVASVANVSWRNYADWQFFENLDLYNLLLKSLIIDFVLLFNCHFEVKFKRFI